MEQPEDDLGLAYHAARRLAPTFEARVRDLHGAVGGHFGVRPGRVKDPARIFEKYMKYREVPLDLLAAKIVRPTLRGVYAAAARVPEFFTVAAYTDRFVAPQASGYRDVQFVVDLGGHLAEVKIMHEFVDELDRHEHRVYEIRRSLDAELRAEAEASPEGYVGLIRSLVIEDLSGSSRRLYNEVWSLVLEREAEVRG